MPSPQPQHSAEGSPRRHIELYEEMCRRMQAKEFPEGPKRTPFDEWVEDSVELDETVEGNCSHQTRIVIHNLGDGDGYFWSCGGWYCSDHSDAREETGPSGQAVWVPGPWELETAFFFGGDGGPRMRIFWQNEDGFLEDDV